MGTIWLPDLPEWIASAGIQVTTYPGWETRSRSSGGYDGIYAIGYHHDASGPNSSPQSNWDWAWKNSSDRPIGAMYLDRTCRVCVGAAGATNTMGKGGPITCSRGKVPQDKGNQYMVAIEVANNGQGEPWSKKLLDTYFALVDVLCDRLGLKVSDAYSHHWYCQSSCPGRKIDPAGPTPDYPELGGTSGAKTWTVDAFRARVSGTTTVPPPDPTPPPSTGDKYTVRTGDTWWSISQKYGCTVDELVAANPPNTSSSIIYPGQVLNIPGDSTPPPTQPPSDSDWIGRVMDTMPVLKKGTSGVYVKRMQHFLALAGYMNSSNMANFDGVFGDGTEGALNRFLASGGRPQNGTCDEYVWRWFMDADNGIATIKKGSSGMDVGRMQRLLSANGYMDPANQSNFDQQWGSGTESGKTKFDNAYGLTPSPPTDCGAKSWESLLTGKKW